MPPSEADPIAAAMTACLAAAPVRDGMDAEEVRRLLQTAFRSGWSGAVSTLMLPMLGSIAVHGVCRDCGAHLLWVRRPNGKRKPYDQSGRMHYDACPGRPQPRPRISRFLQPQSKDRRFA